ncbi:hypothetical protein M8J77_003213 [Diaphorina citri]|nr:hypothetical protein M8J77_003213 [Diaphorina citri]
MEKLRKLFRKNDVVEPAEEPTISTIYSKKVQQSMPNFRSNHVSLKSNHVFVIHATKQIKMHQELVLIVEISLPPPPFEYAFYISLDQVNA